MINKYINDKLSDSSNYKDAVKNFKKLNSFIEKENIIIDPDILLDLFNNSKFKNMIKVLIENNYKSNDDFYRLATEIYSAKNSDRDEVKVSVEENHIKDVTFDYLNEISAFHLLSKEEEVQLAKEIENGNEKARKKFIESNLRLVVYIAKYFINNGLSMQDLVQEGNIGLINAVDKYDYRRGFRFSTYASFWIKQKIIRSIAEKGGNIRIPYNTYDKIRIILKAKQELSISLFRDPTINEISDYLNMNSEEVSELLKYEYNIISLNTRINDDSDNELGDLIPDDSESLEDNVFKNELHDLVKEMLVNCNLNENEIKVITLRYGINSSRTMTLDEIAKVFKVTRERIRQIEAKAIIKMRRSSYARKLVIYLGSIDKLNDLNRKSVLHGGTYKSFLKDDFRTKSTYTIYEYFKNYEKRDVEKALSKLNAKEMKAVIARFGNDLNVATKANLTVEESDIYFGKALPKMKKLLVQMNKK